MSVAVHSSSKFRTAFRLLLWEGAFAMVYDAWTGATYLSGLAGELKAPVIWVSLMCSAAWIGAVGQILGVWAYERVSSYKRFTLWMAGTSRALWILPVVFAAYWWRRGRESGAAFPVETWCALTAGVACLAALFGASSATSWSSWMRALVPESVRGRFFGRRHAYVMLALIVANGIGAICVDWKPNGVYAGFALLGALAVAAATISTTLLSGVMDAGTPVAKGPGSVRELAAWVALPLRDPAFRGVVMYGALFNGAMQIASPYFPYYFTRELGFSMSQIASWTALSNLGCLLAAGFWGRHLDGGALRAKRVMRAMGTLVALSPLYYVVHSVTWVRSIAPLDYLTNGAIWVGYWLALTTSLYRSIPKQMSPTLCFSIYTASAGLCGALGSLTGGWLAERLAPWGGFRALWLITSVLRLTVLWAFYGKLVGNEDQPQKASAGGWGGSFRPRIERLESQGQTAYSEQPGEKSPQA